MHIPAYAHDAIRAAALPSMPTSRQVGGLDCCLCDKPFGKDLAAIPLGPTPTSGLFGCRPCLTRSVTRARRARDAARTHDAERARAESAAWMPVRERHLARLDSLRQAAEAVAGLARGTEVEALRIAWLLVSLESAYTWVPDAPEPPASVDRTDSEMKDEAFRLDLAMIAAREVVAERLAYHLLNEAQPEESEMCEEFECPEECSGRHDSTHIDCGPDAVFEDLADHDITVEQPEPEPLAPRLAALLGRTEAEERHSPLPDLEEQAPSSWRTSECRAGPAPSPRRWNASPYLTGRVRPGCWPTSRQWRPRCWTRPTGWERTPSTGFLTRRCSVGVPRELGRPQPDHPCRLRVFHAPAATGGRGAGEASADHPCLAARTE